MEYRKFFLKRGLRFLPHLFTFGNAFFGFCSLVLAAEGELVAAAYCIFLGALMDALDGRVARMMHVESELGVQLDSLSDAISFCLAPAFLAYAWLLYSLGFIGIFVSALFLLAGLLRLARFNLIHEEQGLFFLGLPTTMAGCFLTIVLLNFDRFTYHSSFIFFFASFMVMLSWFMISSIHFPAFKKKKIRFSKHYYLVTFLIAFAVISVFRLQVILLVSFMLYFLGALAHQLYIYFTKEKHV